MTDPTKLKQTLVKPVRVSYCVILGTLGLVGWLHLATLFLAALFSYLALTRLDFVKRRGKWLAVLLFLVLLGGLAYELAHFINHSVRALPEIADRAIPSIIQWAKQYQVDLPFTDYDSLKELAFGTVTSEVNYLGRFANIARGATRQFVFLAAGSIIAISLFLKPQLELRQAVAPVPNNLYSLCCQEIAERFSLFYQSFATVMGAQIVISAINTVFTTIFVAVVHLPYAIVVVGVTFLCGLVPVIGNLVSNTIIIGIGFTVSPKTALLALVFLVVIHKLEYLLNSKIIGERIRNPLWLTLLSLIIGERLMGVPGMILAPVVLHYLKLETSGITVKGPAAEASGPGAASA
jgi:predicted PurR-regulated permease PerM